MQIMCKSIENTAIVVYFLRDFKNGLVIHKATLSHFKYGFIPRFTAREPNGRFKANKVGIFTASAARRPLAQP